MNILNGCTYNVSSVSPDDPTTFLASPTKTETIEPTNTVSPPLLTREPTMTFPPLWLTHFPTRTPPQAPPGLPPTWTPLPKYPPEQARKTVMDLYKKNNCRLPCLWGIKPGLTSWNEAWQFLGQFATNTSPWETLLEESIEFPGYMYFPVYLNVPKSDEPEVYQSLNDLIFVINIDSFRVDYISVNTGTLDRYTIPRILAEYGRPQKIYVMEGKSQVTDYYGISVYLYYPQYGFMSEHFTTVTDDEWKKGNILACFQKNSNLSLWPQKLQIDLLQLSKVGISGVYPPDLSSYKHIDQVSNYDIENFYQEFVGLNSQPCIIFKSKEFYK
jgi:hypothetical protein